MQTPCLQQVSQEFHHRHPCAGHRHQADKSQESQLHHKCTIFLFHIKMINTQKARPCVDFTHSDTPKSLLLWPDGRPSPLGRERQPRTRQSSDRTSWTWPGRPRAPSSPGLSQARGVAAQRVRGPAARWRGWVPSCTGTGLLSQPHCKVSAPVYLRSRD